MTEKKKVTPSNDQPYKTTERELMTALVLFGHAAIDIVIISDPGDPVIMEWTFPPEVHPFVLQWNRQGKKSIKLDGFTYADIVEAQDVFKSCLHSALRARKN